MSYTGGGGIGMGMKIRRMVKIEEMEEWERKNKQHNGIKSNSNG